MYLVNYISYAQVWFDFISFWVFSMEHMPLLLVIIGLVGLAVLFPPIIFVYFIFVGLALIK